MKKLLSILLLFFCFSATAQNASTIQQLLDEGVSVGELLDAGISVDEFYGKEYQGGLIFDVDTVNNKAKVIAAYPVQYRKPGYINDLPLQDYPLVSTTEEDGIYNTQILSNSYDNSMYHAAINFNHKGYSDWYIPTRSEALKIASCQMNYKFKDEDGVDLLQNWTNIPTSELYNNNYIYIIHGFEYGTLPSASDENINNNVYPKFIRQFDVYSESTVTEIETMLYEGATVGELLDAGISVDEFYGKEYQGGLIFDVDTVNNKAKVIAAYPVPSRKSGYINDLPLQDYPLVSTTEEDGIYNTQILSNSYDNSMYHAAINFNHKGYSDWYIPTRSEALKIASCEMNYKFKDEDGVDLLQNWTNIPTSELYNNNYIYIIHGFSNGTLPSASDENINHHVYPKFIRQFDIYSPTPGSPALQSFLETYTPPVSEEEIVSDANSFDVLNPLSYNGDFEAVHYSFSDGDYTVPSGKTLIINQMHNASNITSANPYIDGVLISLLNSSDVQSNNFKNPIIVSENEVISIDGGEVTIHGVIINRVIETFHHDFSNGFYVVPESKTLLINQFYSSSGSDYVNTFINDVYITNINAYNSGIRNSLNKLVLTEFDTLSIVNGNAFAHGYLIDNSNYTHATDYELINALNEGMDSLSTLSEEVVLEIDSISSQNAILTEENEALMAIDYNFDSLQYVADFLSSQVFELQQELLVPNIEVDMAIGWNMVGFSCPQQKNAEDALINIVDEVIIFKDNSGNVYMPEFSFNGIGDLTPGHGYQIKVTDYILDFNICE